MDFHIWAKLDTEGKIQSVQSSCTQSPHSNPVLPFVFTEQLENGKVQSDAAQSEKVVPYVEKKELVYKLDAKVDEMAVIITQMAELGKRVKVQEKLIAQYEEKLLSNKKKIKALEKENAELKYGQQWTSKARPVSTCSGSESSQSSSLDLKVNYRHAKYRRSLSWPRDCCFSVERFNYPQKETDKKSILKKYSNSDDVIGAGVSLHDEARDQLHKTPRPSTLSLGFDICSSYSGTDVDFEGHFNFHPRETLTANGYSYVKKEDSLALQCSDSREAEKADISVVCDKNNVCSSLHLDNDGYLDMNQSQEIFDMDDNFYSFGQDMDEIVHNKNKQTKGVCKACVDNEAIHYSWIDIKNGNFIHKQDDVDGLAPDEYLEPTVNHHNYVSISEDKISEYADRPPIPSPRASLSFQGSKNSDTLNRISSLSSKSPIQMTEEMKVPAPRDRSTSLPNTAISFSAQKSPRKDGKRSKISKSRSSYSFELPAKSKHHDRASFFVSPSEGRSLCSDTRKDDDFNKVLKDMKTTMEWNKAKKRLISKSNHNTVDTVEVSLRATVKGVYEAYNTLHSEQGSRMNKYPKERVLEKVKEKIRNSHTDDLQSDEFMKKCLDLIHSTSHHAHTP